MKFLLACSTALMFLLCLILSAGRAGEEPQGTAKTETKAEVKAEDSGAAPKDASTAKREGKESEGAPKKVIKSNQEWAKILTRDQFLVTRMKATEPAFSGKYVNNHAKGTYECVCCGAELFSSGTKFNSGTGWPSFYRPLKPDRIETAPDYSAAEARVEVNCSTCGAHLGHVFNDGPRPTGLRFCMNSVALKFVKDKAEPVSKAATKGSKRSASPKLKQSRPPAPAESPGS